VAVYAPVATHGYIDFDDPGYVFNNPHVRAGLSWEGARWAFTTTAQSNWNPLTWLSLMVDAQCFGVDGRLLGLPCSGWQHLEDVAFHALNAILLFLLLRTATSSTWRSAAVAALFALHPLHVESVAWISERKDVLSACLGLACLLAYVHYGRAPGLLRYVPVFGLLALGLLAKPMLVTWPCVMLLMDAWPLGRWTRVGARRLVLEKLPLFALSVSSCVATWISQRDALHLTQVVPLQFRAQNALVQTLIYACKSVSPTGLSILYPYPREIDAGLTLLAGCYLVGTTWLVLRHRQRWPYAAFGWFWYLGTLVPVIGLVQVGLHARADRFTYLPLVGLFVLGAWSAAEFAARLRLERSALAWTAALVLGGYALVSARQVRYWSDTATLFRHACDVTSDNGWAHRILGTALAGQGRSHEAIPEYREALRIWPDDPIAHNNLGAALGQEGQREEALREYREAARLDPSNPTYRRNVARASGQ
jgi:hypothetical protein